MIRAAQRLPEPSPHPSNSAKTCGQSRAAHPHHRRLAPDRGALAGHMGPRRFPPPWTVEQQAACFVVRDDHNGQQLAYVYFEDEPGRRSAAKLLTCDEARRITNPCQTR
jgi:hypothetical protein